MKYAVYGTLRKNQGNWEHLLKNRKGVSFVETKEIEGFDMYAVYSAFPGVVKGDGKITVDIFEVLDENVERSLDFLEGYNPNNIENSMYVKDQLEDGTFIYLWNESLAGVLKIKSGNWVEYNNEKSYV